MIMVPWVKASLSLVRSFSHIPAVLRVDHGIEGILGVISSGLNLQGGQD